MIQSLELSPYLTTTSTTTWICRASWIYTSSTRRVPRSSRRTDSSDNVDLPYVQDLHQYYTAWSYTSPTRRVPRSSRRTDISVRTAATPTAAATFLEEDRRQRRRWQRREQGHQHGSLTGFTVCEAEDASLTRSGLRSTSWRTTTTTPRGHLRRQRCTG